MDTDSNPIPRFTLLYEDEKRRQKIERMKKQGKKISKRVLRFEKKIAKEPTWMRLCSVWSEKAYKEKYLGKIPVSLDTDCDPLEKYGSLHELGFRDRMKFISCL